jgi:hypothetical protein
MKKIAFSTYSLGPNQLAFQAIKNINKYLETDYLCDIIFFHEASTKKCVDANFCCLPSAEIWGYDGDVIACNISSAADLISVPTVKNKFFYVWDLEWINMEEKSYEKLKDIYCNKDLKLITRCSEYAYIINEIWKREAKVIEDFNIEELVDYVDRNK